MTANKDDFKALRNGPYGHGRLDGGIGERRHAHLWPPGVEGHEEYERTYREYYNAPTSAGAAVCRGMQELGREEEPSAIRSLPVVGLTFRELLNMLRGTLLPKEESSHNLRTERKSSMAETTRNPDGRTRAAELRKAYLERRDKKPATAPSPKPARRAGRHRVRILTPRAATSPKRPPV